METNVKAITVSSMSAQILAHLVQEKIDTLIKRIYQCEDARASVNAYRELPGLRDSLMCYRDLLKELGPQ